jgi:hypothetical protein
MVDVQREHRLINKHAKRRNREAGESLIWYEFLPLGEGSSYDDVYDEGDVGPIGRAYGSGIVIPTIYVEEVEDDFRAIDTGRQPVQNLQVVMLMDEVIRSGLTEPWEYQPHLNDMFYYDGRYYKVFRYKVRGRLHNDVLLSVGGTEIYVDQEMNLDVPPTPPFVENLPWPSTFGG